MLYKYFSYYYVVVQRHVMTEFFCHKSMRMYMCVYACCMPSYACTCVCVFIAVILFKSMFTHSLLCTSFCLIFVYIYISVQVAVQFHLEIYSGVLQVLCCCYRLCESVIFLRGGREFADGLEGCGLVVWQVRVKYSLSDLFCV